MPRNRIYVWAAPCPRCEARKDKPCRDMRKRGGIQRYLYGRRTHAERREAVKAMGNPKVHLTRTYLRAPNFTWTQTASAINLATTQYVTAMNNFTTAMTNVGTVAATTTAAWTVTRDEMWNAWVQVNQATTTTTGRVRYDFTPYQQQVWANWNTDWIQVQARADEIARADREQRAREARNRERLRQEQVERAAEQYAQAHETALELFLSLLTEEQRADWAQDESCTVRGSEGGLYEIRSGGVHGNISQIDEHGCRLATLCVAPRMYEDDRYRTVLPTPDGWVGQLLAIRHNEGELKRVANYSYRRECQNPGVPILRDRVA
jgi:hypothetical protein